MRKLIISVRYLTAFLMILMFANALFAQFEKFTVAAKWELYSVKDEKVSFLMPRLPILNEGDKACQGEKFQEFGAYNDGVVYVFRITSKTDTGENCEPKRDFDENNFIRRVKTLRAQFKDFPNTETNFTKDSIIKVAAFDKVVRLVNDYENRRWFELSIYGADESKAEVKKFLASVKIGKAATGKEIGEGALQTFGDDVSKSLVEVRDFKSEDIDAKKFAVKTSSESTYLARMILQPKAKYTAAARQNNVWGSVRLRVAFLANGAIGKIAVISGLPYGLTEEAIAAARKIVFLPEQGSKTRYSVSKTVEYSFAIY